MFVRYKVCNADAGVSPRRLPVLTHQVFRLAPLRLEAHRLNFYRHFPGDYLRDTLHLTAAEDGMYRRLLDLAYTTEKPLPSDRVLMYRLTRCRSRSDKRAIDRVIDEFFTKTRWGYTHKRVQEEIRLAQSRVSASRQNGAHGGRPRKEKTRQVSSRLGKQNLEKSSPDSRLQTPDSQDHVSAAAVNGESKKAAAAFLDIGFDKPFGRPNFQAIWITHFLSARAAGMYITQAMEDAIQECQKHDIGIPPQFYDAKHDVEARETKSGKVLAAYGAE